MGKLFNIKIAEFWWDITCPFTTGVHSPPVPRYIEPSSEVIFQGQADHPYFVPFSPSFSCV
jgi:hypothetical protein